MTPQLQDDLAALRSTRIFFGHQSVGNNIMEGVEALQKDNHVQIPIFDLKDNRTLPEGFIVHTKVGENEKPNTKCDDFRMILDQQLGGNIDIALLKFCYIDINEDTNVQKMFDYYRSVLDGLKHRHPEITFVHVTAPLRYSASGFGVWVREMLGKPNRSKMANIKRNEFNELLRNTYGEEPIFDLAASESTYPNGKRESFVENDKTYYSLIGSYTYDGGHLNEAGRTKVAADLIARLAAVARDRQNKGS